MKMLPTKASTAYFSVIRNNLTVKKDQKAQTTL